MCYADRTFCPADNCNKFTTCPRALTKDVITKANKWWGTNGAPIARFSEPEKLDCFEAIVNTDINQIKEDETK